MADDELIFRGLNRQECSDFTHKLHKLAYEQGRQRDSEWIADRAMICFVDDALLWYDQQSLEIQADWTLLRRALLTHYVNSNPAAQPEPAPVAPIPRVDLTPVAATGGASAAVDPTISTIIYRVKVVTPGYVGYVSKTYVTGAEGRCCILSSNRDDAMTLVEMAGADHHSISGLFLAIEGSESNGYYEYLGLASLEGAMHYHPATWRGWLAAARRLSNMTYSINDDSQPNVGLFPTAWTTDKDGTLYAVRLCTIAWSHPKYGPQRRPDGGDSRETWKAFSDKFIPVIGNIPSGEKTLYFWSRRVWEDNDEQFVAGMYLERVV